MYVNLLVLFVLSCGNSSLLVERISPAEYQKTKTKAIMTANKKKGKYHKEPIRTQCQKKKRGKILVTKLRSGLALQLIGCEDGASFLDQSTDQLKKTRTKWST